MKAFHITDCLFELPSDFDGSVGDVLMLMANRAKQAEAYKEMYECEIYDMYEYFTKDKKGKCVMNYAFIDIE